ncbi:hypothetical protein GCM10008967_07070 [Bacillus carboniphilus]|uniref:Transposase n=1 Tax=Bacillus carboniphilus TaxID=86663 RepID=A0ABN0VX66_9BACI
MKKENKKYTVLFTEEFSLCLDYFQQFFSEQGEETLQWWYSKEDEIIDYIESYLSNNPFMGKPIEDGTFKGLRRITYGKSRHVMLNRHKQTVEPSRCLPSYSGTIKKAGASAFIKKPFLVFLLHRLVLLQIALKEFDKECS